MRDRLVRVLLLAEGLPLVPIALWAAVAPRSFYDDFPGFGRVWVAADGPYNEHLVRDFGALNLAIAVVAIAAAARPVTWIVRAVAVALLAYTVPHLAYHLRHLELYDTTDQVLNVTALGVAALIPVALLAVTARSRFYVE